jgi:hypothetical protein
MAAWIHPVVQHANDLDHAVVRDTIVQDMHRCLDLWGTGSAAGVCDVKAAKASAGLASRNRAMLAYRARLPAGVVNCSR